MYKQNQILLELITPVVTAMGYELLGIEHLKQGRYSLVRLYIDSKDGVNLSDCESVSKQVTGVLDVEDPIQGTYNLEVSSPGLDRPIFTLDQFQRHIGETVRVTLSVKQDGSRKYAGRLNSVGDSCIVIESDEGEITLAEDIIEVARLVPNI
ncbi:MAG: ribosome maturation factor RimP [Gammaproteobacteria bacterium]|nr:ribosome maturation factor RimP [Gammaproteobacteria bacterium]